MRRPPRNLASALGVAALLAAFGCETGVPDALRVGGATGFVRCLALPAPESRAWAVGDLSLDLRGRSLTLRASRGTLRIAAFTGPAPVVRDTSPALRALVAGHADVLLVLGGLGDDRASAEHMARALADTGRLALFLAGGRDAPDVVAAALAALDPDARDRVLDVSSLERVAFGEAELVPIAGAPGGRYARSADACGHVAADLDERAAALGEAGNTARRVLVSWAAAAPAAGVDGAEAGDAGLARFASRIGARDAVAAWPREQAGRALPGAGLRRVVPPLAGFAARTSEGGRAGTGALWLTLGPTGLTAATESARP